MRNPCLAAIGLCLCATLAQAQAPSIDPALGDVTVTADLPKDGPYVGELILLTLRSSIRAQITLHDIRQPALQNFDWQQFGNDRAIETMVKGFRVAGIERSLAVFPRKAGHLVIEPFVRHITIMTASGERLEGDFASQPLEIEVRAHDGVEPPGAWWLPAHAVTIRDSWDPAPEKLGLNETAQRILVIEAAGITADRLPPPPALRAPGLISFVGPAERTTLVTPDGPVARAVYHWNIRPVSDAAAMVPAIHIPWFDTGARQMRDASVPERRVSFINPLGEARQQAATAASQGWLTWRGLAVALAAFVWALAVQSLLAAGGRGWAWVLPLPAPLRSLQRAARRGDVAGFGAALAAAQRLAPERWRAVSTMPEIAAGLAAVDACRYGDGPRQPPPLRPLARLLARHWRAPVQAPGSGALLPVDGGAPVCAGLLRWRRMGRGGPV